MPDAPKARSGFDFTVHMRRLCDDLVRRLPALHHIDLDRVAIGFAQARKRSADGLQAALTPMRFENGSLTTLRNGRRWSVQRLFDDGREMLYVLNFYLPRFLDLTFNEKLVTVVHELWHIGERFDGDLRRHDGRCYAHTHSQQQYDRQMQRLVDQYLSQSPDATALDWLRLTFRELQQRHGGVFGRRFAHPKLIPLPPDAMPAASRRI